MFKKIMFILGITLFVLPVHASRVTTGSNLASALMYFANSKVFVLANKNPFVSSASIGKRYKVEVHGVDEVVQFYVPVNEPGSRDRSAKINALKQVVRDGHIDYFVAQPSLLGRTQVQDGVLRNIYDGVGSTNLSVVSVDSLRRILSSGEYVVSIKSEEL